VEIHAAKSVPRNPCGEIHAEKINAVINERPSDAIRSTTSGMLLSAPSRGNHPPGRRLNPRNATDTIKEKGQS